MAIPLWKSPAKSEFLMDTQLTSVDYMGTILRYAGKYEKHKYVYSAGLSRAYCIHPFELCALNAECSFVYLLERHWR